MSTKPGLILIDKPVGLTSFQLLSPVKRAAGTKKVGHAGTLDKFASGLMLVLIGQATRFVQFLTAEDKEYVADIRFGEETETLDPEGAVTERAAPPDRETVEQILPRFTGAISQRPPAFSAVHIDGKRAYKRALDGEVPEMPEREVTIHSLELLEWDGDRSEAGSRARIRVSCSKGTYIRSLARDIALAAGSRGHLSALRRTRVGAFTVDMAQSPDELGTSEALDRSRIWGRQLIERIDGISAVDLPPGLVGLVDQGQPLDSGSEGIPELEPGLHALIDAYGNIRALVEADAGRKTLKYRGVFNRLDI
jgi:tRNA pseudouridine55 synthase